MEQLPEELVHEQRDVLPAFPEGQGVDGGRIQKEKQLFPKVPCFTIPYRSCPDVAMMRTSKGEKRVPKTFPVRLS